jgi:hypothetical protein
MDDHIGDHFQQPPNDAPYFGQTSWHTVAIPERRLTAQLYGFFLPNLGICAAAAYVWDHTGDSLSTCRYAKNFWHLPMPAGDLPDVELANGIRLRRVEPGMRYELHYRDPDNAPEDGEIDIDLVFQGLAEPHMLGAAHLDQPGHVTGRIRLGEESIDVDAIGMRDSTWNVRSPFGGGMQAESPGSHGGYDWGVTDTAPGSDGFHLITREDPSGRMPAIAGFMKRNGELGRVVSGEREVLERIDDHPSRVRLHLVDDLGRESTIDGRSLNALGMHRTPNAWTWNCLTDWQWDGRQAWGEDHDNWSAAGVRHFRRSRMGSPTEGSAR